MPQIILNKISEMLQKLREQKPLVHCITNYVSMDIMANGLLALGASPVMVHAPEEVEECIAVADALLVNIGTLSTPWVEGMMHAISAAKLHGKPWVFDPVGCGLSKFRTQVSTQIVDLNPTVIRGNASEIMALEGKGLPRGVQSVNTVTDSITSAHVLSKEHGSVVVATGPSDWITDGIQAVRVHNGTSLMTSVTAVGCLHGAIIAAFAAVESNLFSAVVAATLVTGIAGELAQHRSSAPGSFRMHFLDQLATLEASELEALARFEIRYEMAA